MAWEIGFQSQIESYQRLRKWYLIPPCLIVSIIKCISRVKWCDLGKEVAPLHHGVVGIEKGTFGPTLYICVAIYICVCVYVCLYIFVCVCMCVCIYMFIYLCMCVYIYIYKYVHVHICIYMRMHVYVFVYAFINKYVCAYIYNIYYIYNRNVRKAG